MRPHDERNGVTCKQAHARQATETEQLLTLADTTVRADRTEIERLIAALDPLSGGIWLATDFTTRIHWTIRASHVSCVTGALEGRACRASGLVTVCDPDFLPIFLIHEGDTLEWLDPGQTLAVRELGQESLEIRIERLDDLDARIIDRVNVGEYLAIDEMIRTISIGDGQFVQIYDEQLPTGDGEADAALQLIETTIEARRRLIGPASGTLDVLNQMERDLDDAMRVLPVASYVWAAVILERIALMREHLAA